MHNFSLVLEIIIRRTIELLLLNFIVRKEQWYPFGGGFDLQKGEFGLQTVRTKSWIDERLNHPLASVGAI